MPLDEQYLAFARRVTERTRELGLTHEDLAAAVGVARQVVARWTSGTWPSARFLPALADALGMSLDELLRDPPTRPGRARRP